MTEKIKFTVATVTYNAANVIKRTLDSVEEQDYPYVEHLMIDGNSHDGTVAEFLHYQERNAREARHEVNAVSEPYATAGFRRRAALLRGASLTEWWCVIRLSLQGFPLRER